MKVSLIDEKKSNRTSFPFKPFMQRQENKNIDLYLKRIRTKSKLRNSLIKLLVGIF